MALRLSLLAATLLYAAEKVKPYDLTRDETRGGNTLTEHVGRKDSDLFAQLKKDPKLEMASTYFERPVAERTIGTVLNQSAAEFVHWMQLTGARPNLTLHYSGDRTLGHCLVREQHAARGCSKAVVILKWQGNGFIVLSSYPVPK